MPARKVRSGGRGRGGEETYDGDGVGLADYGAGEDEVIGSVCKQVRNNNDGDSRVDNAWEVPRRVLHFSGDKVDLRSCVKSMRAWAAGRALTLSHPSNAHSPA